MAWQAGKTRQQTARGPRQLAGRAWAGDAALQTSRRNSAKTTWRVVITIAAIDGEVFQADGRGDLRMQQAAAKFSHEILWW
jgi:hypothetical protein